MSSSVDSALSTQGADLVVSTPEKLRPLHRLGEVRRSQGISRKTIARKLNVNIPEVVRQEEETCDLPLSALYMWQEVLGVPIGELLVEPQDALAQPMLLRAQLVRFMKTAVAICEQSGEKAIRLMAQNLANQLIEIMPELRGVCAWHAVGQRRKSDELGVAAQRSLPDDIFKS